MPSVLVIDDNPAFRMALRRRLESLGFEVMAARTGEHGLQVAKARGPDLVLVDLCLGPRSRLSGTDVLSALKAEETTRGIPAIAMSAVKEGAEDEVQARRSGADDFLAKREIAAHGGKPLLRRLRALLLLSAREPASSPRRAPGSLPLTVLVIDDQEETAELVKAALGEEPGCRVLWAPSGARGLRLAAGELPDLIVLDLIMPGLSGQEVCRRLRAQPRTAHLPILVLTADASDREVECIEMGADDYLVRHAGAGRLAARIRRLIRRHRFRGDPKGALQVGKVRLEPGSCRLLIGGRSVALTPLESGICALLMAAAGEFLDKRVLYKKLYNAWPPPGSASVKVHVRNIRKKLGAVRDLIVSRKDRGYGFDADYAQSLPPEPAG